VQAARLLERAGFSEEAEVCDHHAFACVQDAVREGAKPARSDQALCGWLHDQVHVSAPARVDFGGGWSDTPPFCFDWGGTVLNCALEIEGEYPIETEIVRISEPIIRCVAETDERVVEYRSTEELLEPCRPGSVERGSVVSYRIADEGFRVRICEKIKTAESTKTFDEKIFAPATTRY
jgi:fucokinase